MTFTKTDHQENEINNKHEAISMTSKLIIVHQTTILNITFVLKFIVCLLNQWKLY